MIQETGEGVRAKGTSEPEDFFRGQWKNNHMTVGVSSKGHAMKE